MKKMIVVLFVLFLTLAGCSSEDVMHEEGYTSDPDSTGDTEEFALYDGAITTDRSGDVTFSEDGVYYSVGSLEVEVNQMPSPDSGLLTASEFSDLENYLYYLSLYESSQDGEDGIFTEYEDNGYFDMLHMVKVEVSNDVEVLNGVTVQLMNDAQEVIDTALTDVYGNAYLFPKQSELESIQTIQFVYDAETKSIDYTYSTEGNSIEATLTSSNTHQDVIELMFVIDTTGSMGDEINYLKSEIDYVINEVSTIYTNTTIRLALLLYRDQGDDYVTRYFDFTENIAVQKQNLSNQSAGGGGDYPEAVSVALDEAVNKNWSTDNTTKLVFHILDAPPHEGQVEMNRYVNALNKASELGIRIIPVASSGINKYTEYLLRNQAMLTGGTYVHLTNHSGIGGDHIDASTPETEVELLNFLMIRLIIKYHTGEELTILPY